MKLNFRKIASVLSSAVMVSSTVALAAAASYPAPFVNNGVADVAVVWGSTATLDNAAVTDIVASLNSKVTPGTTGSTTVTGESFTLQKEKKKFHLGNAMNSIYSKLTYEELPTLLQDGLEYKGVTKSEYSQEITLGTKVMTHFLDKDFNDNKPIIGFDYSSAKTDILNYTLKLDAPVSVKSSTNLVMMGKKYFIAENSSTDHSITLLDASASQRINEGETLTVEATNGKTYTVKLDFVDDGGDFPDEANFVVNDVSYDSLEEGDVEEVDDGVYLAVNKAKYSDSDRVVSYAQFSLGTGKLTLTDGSEVELNDEPLSQANDLYENQLVTAHINDSSGKLQSITLNWKSNGDVWFAPGTDLVMPGFESVKVSMAEFYQPESEEVTLEGSGDTLYLNAEIAQGEVSVPILHQDGNGASDKFDAIGSDTDEWLSTSTTSGGSVVVNFTDANDTMAVLSYWDGNEEAESFLVQLSKIDYDSSTGKTKVTLKNLVPGQSEIVLTDINDDASLGSNLDLTLLAANKTTGFALVNVSAGGTVYTDRLFTKGGLTAYLPVADTAGDPAYPKINLANSTSSANWKANFTEQNKDGKYMAGGSFAVGLSLDDADGIYPSSLSGPDKLETEKNSDKYVAYVVSDVATKIEFDETSDVKTMLISHPTGESYAEVMVAESGATVSDGATGNIVPIFDTAEVPTTKNLIVVGGSCVNTLAAQLLGLPANSCGSAWQTKTGVGAGQFLIQTFARDNSKVATLVAGYNMEDTANAVKALKTDTTVEIAAGKKFVGTATSVNAVAVA